jgi:hypothetical protein
MKSRASRNHFAGIPFQVMRSANFRNMSAYAAALLLDIREQFKRPEDNGNLDATWSRLSKYPRWGSKRTLYNALGELSYYGMIERTRKGKRIGGKHYPSLYAVTWEPIGGFPEKGIRGTAIASNKWREPRPRWQAKKRPPRKTPSSTRILDTPSPSSKGILGKQNRCIRENELMRGSQVAAHTSQVAHGYSLYKLPEGRGFSDVLTESITNMPAALLKTCTPVGAAVHCKPILLELAAA